MSKKPTWHEMSSAYKAMLDRLAPVGPGDAVSEDMRKGAMQGAIRGNAIQQRHFATSVAAGAPDRAGKRALYRATRLWQSGFNQAVMSARAGQLRFDSHGDHAEYVFVYEPFSGIGVKFFTRGPVAGRISSDGGAKSRPTVFAGRIADENGFTGHPEHFVGVGIGRWVYLNGARYAAPEWRWATLGSGLRADSGSPHVRAWLHHYDPYHWAPVYDATGHASCRTCARPTEDGTHQAWQSLRPDARSDEHPRVHIPPTWVAS